MRFDIRAMLNSTDSKSTLIRFVEDKIPGGGGFESLPDKVAMTLEQPDADPTLVEYVRRIMGPEPVEIEIRIGTERIGLLRFE